jgi:two-component system response regulator MprA
VADEDPTMLWLLRRTLAADFDVTVAEDGQRAVDLARSTNPHVVLLDLTMPVLDGVEACQMIRAVLPHVPILIVSGHTDESSVVNAFAAGATDYVVKPFSLSQLRARVRACLLRVR